MSDEKDPANEPAYEQLGDAGNPFTHPDTDAAGQPDLDTETEDELDRAERHD